MLCVIEALFEFYKHIIDIDLHGFAQQLSEYLSYQPLISWLDILRTKRHHIVAVQPVRCNEGRFL